MRDDSIMRLHEANARREMLILRQFEFLQTKVQATEEILAVSWLTRLLAIFDHETFRRQVDNRQKELLAERDRAFNEAMGKPKLNIVRAGNGV